MSAVTRPFYLGSLLVWLLAACGGSSSEPETRHTLTVTVVGNGAVTGEGISCGDDCTEAYPAGTRVTLTAAAAGSSFSGWSGACSGAGTCTVTMDGRKQVEAAFEAQTGSRITGYTMTPPSPATLDRNGRVEVTLSYALAEADVGTVAISAVPLSGGRVLTTPLDGKDYNKIVFQSFTPRQAQGSRTLSFYPSLTPGAFDETVTIDAVRLVIFTVGRDQEDRYREEVATDYTFTFEPPQESDFRITRVEPPAPITFNGAPGEIKVYWEGHPVTFPVTMELRRPDCPAEVECRLTDQRYEEAANPLVYSVVCRGGGTRPVLATYDVRLSDSDNRRTQLEKVEIQCVP
ncbi:InlB B-repeat-containing protein [Truepera radiovictrix]|uniref:Bacterial repeat domain-containing protein n=1 Tax=Truepera radiovictrix (strain DSM 17093 / CIP 108686 / LMG 22925 / RQ-24) TaxID=649638 RepID=D7CW71_TRURR|nr:hypothetical protein [Truepera radiovictrix]ADI14334.1 hypothetical protein Trad_1211 [Truepera radiovictrix DSM 17093]WMT57108.1 hypothetical protein RCV51_13945 [Truepera radiovictrix]